jgi:beta-glucosidase
LANNLQTGDPRFSCLKGCAAPLPCIAASLKATKGQYLPTFTAEQKKLLNGSLDFIAANCFTAKYVSAKPGSTTGFRQSKTSPSGQLIGPQSGVSWINVVPGTQAKMLRYITRRYSLKGAGGTMVRPAVLISSSGVQVPGEEKMRPPAVLQDDFR